MSRSVDDCSDVIAAKASATDSSIKNFPCRCHSCPALERDWARRRGLHLKNSAPCLLAIGSCKCELAPISAPDCVSISRLRPRGQSELRLTNQLLFDYVCFSSASGQMEEKHPTTLQGRASEGVVQNFFI